MRTNLTKLEQEFMKEMYNVKQDLEAINKTYFLFFAIRKSYYSVFIVLK